MDNPRQQQQQERRHQKNTETRSDTDTDTQTEDERQDMASLSDYPALARGRRHREMSSLSQLNRNREAFPRHFDLSYIAAMLSTPFGIAGCGILLVVLILPSIVTILGWFAVLYLGFLFYSRLLDPSPLRLQPIPTISEDSQRIQRELTNVQENATSSFSVGKLL